MNYQEPDLNTYTRCPSCKAISARGRYCPDCKLGMETVYAPPVPPWVRARCQKCSKVWMYDSMERFGQDRRLCAECESQNE